MKVSNREKLVKTSSSNEKLFSHATKPIKQHKIGHSFVVLLDVSKMISFDKFDGAKNRIIKSH